MGGHGHGEAIKIPDYKQYSIKGIRELEEVEKALSQRGLKDPWLRNEAWRYHPGFGSAFPRAMKLLFRGAPLGAALAGAHYAYHLYTAGDAHAHGHGDGDAHAHH